MKILALTSATGHVAVMRLIVEDQQEKALRDFAAVSFAPVKVTEISESDVPPDREFRDAWVLDGAKINHSIEKAREIKRNHIRAERAPRLTALDADFIRALEAGADTKAIAAEKQRLRDAPAHPGIEAATTIADLKAVKPL